MNLYGKYQRSLIFFCAVILILPFLGEFNGLAIPCWYMRLIFLVVVTPLLLSIYVLDGEKFKFEFTSILLPLWIIATLAIVTAFFALNKYDAWTGAVKWIFLLSLGVIVHNLIKRREHVYPILFCAGLSGGFVALIGILQYLFGLELYKTPTLEYPWPTSTVAHKNQAAGFIVLTAPISLYLLRTTKSIKNYWLFSIILALMAVLLVYTFARQAFVALVIELIALSIVFRCVCPNVLKKNYLLTGRRKKATAFSVILFLLLILSPSFDKSVGLENTAINRMFAQSQKSYRNGVDLESASKGRLKTWATTVKMIPDLWYGVGALNWQSYYPKYSAVSKENYNLQRSFYWRYTHNDYLQTLIEFGVFSIFAFGCLMFGLYKVCRLSLSLDSEEGRYQVFSMVVALLGTFTVMCFSFPLSLTIQPAFLSIYLGVLSGIYVLWNKSEVEIGFKIKKIWIPVFLLISSSAAYAGYRVGGGWHYAQSAAMIHRYVERNLYDKEKYPDVSSYSSRIEEMVLKSEIMDPYNARLDMMRGGLFAYLALVDPASEKRDWYLEKSFGYLSKVEAVFPYYAYPEITKSQLYGSLGKPEMERVALERVLVLAPGDISSVKKLSVFYMERKNFSRAFEILDAFFVDFYDSELLNIYVFVAQESGLQAIALQRISKINLENFIEPRLNEEDFKKNSDIIARLIHALTQQIRPQE